MSEVLPGFSKGDLEHAINTNDERARWMVRAAFRRSLYVLSKVATCWFEPENLMDAEVFREAQDWIQWVVVDKKRGLCEDPRGHIKSTRVTRSVPKWIAIQRPHEEYDHPNEYERAVNFLATHPHLKGVDSRLVIASQRVSRAGDFIGSDKADWEMNPLLRWAFPEMIWPSTNRLPYGHWSNLDYSLPGRLQPTLADGFCRAVGMESAEQGGRAEGIIYDDLIGDSNHDSETECKKARNWFRSSGQLLENSDYNDPRGGFILVCENRWGLDEVNSLIHDELHDWAIWRRGAYRCYVHGSGNCGRWGSDEARECGFTEEPLWKGRYPTTESLVNVARDKGDEIFATQWLNDPSSISDLDASKFKDFILDVQAHEGTRQWVVIIPPVKPGEPQEVIPVKQLEPHIVSIDPATSKDKNSCRMAISWVALDRATMRRFWLDCHAGRFGEDDGISEAFNVVTDVQNRTGLDPRVVTEKVAGQAFVAPALRWRSVAAKKPIKQVELVPPAHGVAKDDRIRRRISNIANQGLLYVRAGLQLPRSEARHFPTGSKDALDSFAQAEEVFQQIFSTTSSTQSARARKRRRQARISAAGRTGAPL